MERAPYHANNDFLPQKSLKTPQTHGPQSWKDTQILSMGTPPDGRISLIASALVQPDGINVALKSWSPGGPSCSTA